MRDGKEEQSGKPFSVRRWRISADEERPERLKGDGQLKGDSTPERSLVVAAQEPPQYETATSSPGIDLLLHLIHQNVFRGFASNKQTLRPLLSEIRHDYPSVGIRRNSFAPCDGLFINMPLSGNIPVSLAPTQIQKNVPHSAWINIIPFPRVRDNIIMWHDHFDHWEFLYDMVGLFADAGTLSVPPRKHLGSAIEKPWVDHPADIDDPLAEYKGAIVWGAPYLQESWEFSAAFLQKWAWMFEGYEEIVHMSNNWRRERGAAPLQLAGCVALGTGPTSSMSAWGTTGA